jgi:uncharacterized protein YceK
MNPTARVAPVSLAVVTTIVLSGCASSLSGVGSTESYACKAPIGAQCTSVSGVYANANPLAARAVHEAPLPPQSLLATMAGPLLPVKPNPLRRPEPRWSHHPAPRPVPRRRPALRRCARPLA